MTKEELHGKLRTLLARISEVRQQGFRSLEAVKWIKQAVPLMDYTQWGPRFRFHAAGVDSGYLPSDADWNEMRSYLALAVAHLEAQLEEVAPSLPDQLKQHLPPHPLIRDAAEKLYQDGHYAQAVFEGCKAFVELVQRKSGSALDGTSLMSTVFSKDSPLLAVNELADDADSKEQQGFMFLSMGVTLGIRNPRGHRAGFIDSAESAAECLALLSLLARRVDNARRLVKNSA